MGAYSSLFSSSTRKFNVLACIAATSSKGRLDATDRSCIYCQDFGRDAGAAIASGGRVDGLEGLRYEDGGVNSHKIATVINNCILAVTL